MSFEWTEVWTPALVFVRLVSMLLVAPVFGHLLVPMRVRTGLAVALAVALAPTVPQAPDLASGPALGLVAAMVQEVLIGSTLGFATGMVFSGFALMGEFASVQGGLGAATVLDPTSGASSVVLTSMIQLTALAVFLGIDGHHALLRGLLLSFEAFPPGAGGVSAGVFEHVVAMASVIFEVGVRLAFPVTAAMFVSNIAVGMLGRAIPQLNLMALQLPAHVALTLLILGLGAPPLVDAMRRVLTETTERAIATSLGGG